MSNDKFDALLTQLQALAKETAGLRVEVEKIDVGVATLFKILNGNGSAGGLVTSFRLTEERLRLLQEAVDALAERGREVSSAGVTGRWAFWAAFASGILGLLAGLLAL